MGNRQGRLVGRNFICEDNKKNTFACARAKRKGKQRLPVLPRKRPPLKRKKWRRLRLPRRRRRPPTKRGLPLPPRRRPPLKRRKLPLKRKKSRRLPLPRKLPLRPNGRKNRRRRARARRARRRKERNDFFFTTAHRQLHATFLSRSTFFWGGGGSMRLNDFFIPHSMVIVMCRNLIDLFFFFVCVNVGITIHSPAVVVTQHFE